MRCKGGQLYTGSHAGDGGQKFRGYGEKLAVTQQVEEGYARLAQLFVYLSLIAFRPC